jgi:hypothetical protein
MSAECALQSIGCHFIGRRQPPFEALKRGLIGACHESRRTDMARVYDGLAGKICAGYSRIDVLELGFE